MATRKAADHTLYHLSPKGFWKKFRGCFPEPSSVRLDVVANVSLNRRCGRRRSSDIQRPPSPSFKPAAPSRFSTGEVFHPGLQRFVVVILHTHGAFFLVAFFLTQHMRPTFSVRSGAKPVLETGRPPRLSTALRRHAIRALHPPDSALGCHPRVNQFSIGISPPIS
jgi:hypothetical protein